MKNRPYIIGEIGQNHNGSVEIAKAIIDLAPKKVWDPVSQMEYQGLNAVKLTKRDLNQELTNSQMKSKYSSIHSFGLTYGEHRKYLELSDEQHNEIYKYAKSSGFEFIETLCAVGCTSIFKYFIPDKLKVASRDLTNLPLLEVLAETQIPIILSTGMSGKKELDEALNIITKTHSNISILHCVSQYPTLPKNVNLLTISYLKKYYSDYVIGYSDHTIGISAPAAAVALGAEIIEKHITLDRRLKGTDQAGSLGPDGLLRMVRDIRIISDSLGVEDIFVVEDTIESQKKLERSIASKRMIMKGELIRAEDLHLLSPGDGFKWIERDMVINKLAEMDILVNEIIYPNMIQK